MYRLISVHIPKTGGTSLLHAMRKAHKVEKLYYGEPKDAEILHGHFTASYARENFPNVPIIAITRSPRDHIASLYAHYRAHPKEGIVPLIKDLPQGLSFEDFQDVVGDYQGHFLDDEVDYIGTTENLEQSVKEINSMFGLDIPTPDRLNQRKEVA